MGEFYAVRVSGGKKNTIRPKLIITQVEQGRKTVQENELKER
nr:MAG TPA: hypothetical protein [Caudoviricetes sp.]